MPPFKDEHILIIAPGSQTTLAQLGLPESFTPARWRFPTRMFTGEKPGEWEPVKIRPVQKKLVTNGVHPEPKQDVEMGNAVNGEVKTKDTNTIEDEARIVEEPTFEENPHSTEDAVYPLKAGQIENWSCFFALLTHIFNTLSPPFHTPILVISQPCWSARDHELVTQFFFENFKMPAFCLMDSAQTACYAYGVPTATVIDVGYEKCDITAVTEFVVSETGRGSAISGCGGRSMTKRLAQASRKRQLTEDMCEQLKKSPACEILTLGTPLPGNEQHVEDIANPAAAASTGATDSGPNATDVDGAIPGMAPRGPGPGTDVGQEGTNHEDEDNEGVLDVASIVAKGNASEFLAKREKEKADKAAAKKGADAIAKQARLKNSERVTTTFSYEDYVPLESEATAGDSGPRLKKRKRDVEVGVERFMAAHPTANTSDSILDTIAGAIYHTILSVSDVTQRSILWDNLIILGNGSRIRGFIPALLGTLAQRYTLSPSTATIFTSELPSNFSTPLPTGGTNTPIPGQPSQPMHHPAAHGVNPLLVAATRHANQTQNQTLQVPGLQEPQQHHSRGHNQTPTSIRIVRPPEYFPEWKDPHFSGMEEAGFLGAQVAAKVIFVVDQGISKGFLTRGEYNEMGPGGIHECAI